MERRSSKRSTVAFLCACVWTMIVLCLSMPQRPAEKAQAASLSPNDLIMVKAADMGNGNSSDVTKGDIKVWGTFYRGVQLYSQDESADVTAGYKTGKKYEGKIVEGTTTIRDVEDTDDYDTVTLTSDSEADSVGGVEEVTQYADGTTDCPYYAIGGGSYLHTFDDCEHEFTYGAGKAEWESIDNDTHWAVCSCGFKLQVGHRPGADGTCLDCGASLGDNYINEYSFTVPESIPDTGEWETDDENTYISFDITLDENATKIFEGFTLILKMQSENGGLVFGKDTGAYAVSVADDIGGETFEFDDASELKDKAQTIWQLEVDESTGEPTEEDGDFRRKIGGTITVTLTLTDPPVYPGEYSDTLTFSAELIVTGEGTS